MKNIAIATSDNRQLLALVIFIAGLFIQ